MTTHCGRLQLERYFTGDLPDAEVKDILAHVGNCAECSAVLSALSTEKSIFLEKHPFASFTRAHAPLKTAPWYRRLSTFFWQPALRPVYGVLLFALIAGPLVNKYYPSNETTHFKGASGISYFYKSENGVKHAAPSDRFRSGDIIQIVYSTTRSQHFSLFSIDSSGTVSFYQPKSSASECSIPVHSGSNQPYPVSIELDSTPGNELVVALFTDAPLTASLVKEWVRTSSSTTKSLINLLEALKSSSSTLSAEVSTILLYKE